MLSSKNLGVAGGACDGQSALQGVFKGLENLDTSRQLTEGREGNLLPLSFLTVSGNWQVLPPPGIPQTLPLQQGDHRVLVRAGGTLSRTGKSESAAFPGEG